MLRVHLLLVFAIVACAYGQPPTPSESQPRIQDFQRAVQNSDFTLAAELATKLNESVQRQYRLTLVRDAREQIAEVLTWLPADIETFFVMQDQTTIDTKDILAKLYGDLRLYAIKPLVMACEGPSRQVLDGKTLRLAAAGMRNMRSRGTEIPGPMPDADVAYFYFFADPIEPAGLGPPVQSYGKLPLWRGAENSSQGTGVAAHPRDEAWLALPRPEVMVIARKREFLIELLGRIVKPPSDRALPDSLPEWSQVDRQAPFWGLRHYAKDGSPDTTNPLVKTERQRAADPRAIGVTVQFYRDRDDLEIRYLSAAAKLPSTMFWFTDPDVPPRFRFFQTDVPHAGIVRLKSNAVRLDPFAFHIAAQLLGFGAGN